MKDKIYKYLCNENTPIDSAHILKKFFYSVSQKGLSTEKIIEAVLKDDSRFVKDAEGRWQTRKTADEKRISVTVFSVIEFDIIPAGKNAELPIAVGIGLTQNLKLLTKKLFVIEDPVLISEQLKKIKAMQLLKINPSGSISNNLEDIYQSLSNTVLINKSPRQTVERLNWLIRQHGGIAVEIDMINLKDLIRKVRPEIKTNSLGNIAQAFNLNYEPKQNLSQQIDLMIDISIDLIRNLAERKIITLKELDSYVNESVRWIDFSKYSFDQNYIENLPEVPGIYMMKNNRQKIFYVGKAKNLRNRVSSYFVNKKDLDQKSKKIANQICDLHVEVAGSELEALLLENKYINQYQPNLNIQLNIYKQNEKQTVDQRIVVFLSSKKINWINLFFINGEKSAIQTGVDLKSIDKTKIRDILKKLFFSKDELVSDFTEEQIEIIWRWFGLNKYNINYFDIDDFGTLDRCLTILMNYLNDSRLLIEKIEYH